MRNLIYVGNHGLEMWHNGRKAGVVVPPSSKEAIAHIRSRLADLAAEIPGALVEDKGLSLSVHYRLVPEWLERRFMKVFAREIIPLVRSSELIILYGKKVVELRPRVNWTKGHAALWVMTHVRQRSALPIYIGDDLTDEDAFGALAEGITIRVGAHGESTARYYVRDVKEWWRSFNGWAQPFERDSDRPGQLPGGLLFRTPLQALREGRTFHTLSTPLPNLP